MTESNHGGDWHGEPFIWLDGDANELKVDFTGPIEAFFPLVRL